MKHVFEVQYKKYSTAEENITVYVVASGMERAVVAARKAIKKNEYEDKTILMIEQQEAISAID